MTDKKQYDVPQTLLEAARYFANPDVCVEFVKKLCWPFGVTCPCCESKKTRYIKTRRVWACKECKKQFSVKVGTIFEDSPLPLDKWLLAVWMIANCKNGVSSWEMHRTIGVTQKTAWFMLQRIRLAMQTGSFDKLSGEIEATRRLLAARPATCTRAKGRCVAPAPSAKAVVMGLLERQGKVRVKHVKGTKRKHVATEVRENVTAGAEIFTDALKSYTGLSDEYVHQFVDHAIRYVDGKIHVNGMENFWSLLKRALKGTYISVQPLHLFRYLDDEAYRFNNRDSADCVRFMEVLMAIAGKRLTYKHLIDREEDDPMPLS